MGSLRDHARPDVVEAVRAQRDRTLRLLEALDDDQWETEVTPGWRVREVAAHLITTDEGAVTGRMLRIGLNRPIADVEAWNETQVGRWADRPLPSLLGALDRWGRRIVRALTIAPFAHREIPTPLGTVSLLWLGMMRVYDEWVHDEDIRRALSLPSDDAPAVVTPVARQLLAALPVQTLPRISPAASGHVTLVIEDVDVPAVGVDLDERRYGTPLAGDETRIIGRAAPLILVAARRDAWRDAEAAGSFRVDGDRGAAETFLDAFEVV